MTKRKYIIGDYFIFRDNKYSIFIAGKIIGYSGNFYIYDVISDNNNFSGRIKKRQFEYRSPMYKSSKVIKTIEELWAELL